VDSLGDVVVMDPNKEPHYLEFYRGLTLRPKPTILELGVQHGGSLELWRKLWPDAIIIGVDNDPNARWPEGTSKIVAEQDDPSMLAILPSWPFDLVIDDASHMGDKSFRSWQLFWPHCAGVYVWEDYGACTRQPDHYGDPERLLTAMATEVELHAATRMIVKPGFISLWRY